MQRRRPVLAALLAAGVVLGATACETTRDEDTTELEDQSEERQDTVDEGVNEANEPDDGLDNDDDDE